MKSRDEGRSKAERFGCNVTDCGDFMKFSITTGCGRQQEQA